MKRLLAVVALVVAGCFPVPPEGATFYIEDGMLCWESAVEDPEIGSAMACEVLP